MGERQNKPGKIRSELRKIHEMPPREAFGYIWYYYKGIILTIAGIAVALIILYLPSDTRTQQYQCYIDDYCYIAHVDYMDGFIDYLGKDPGKNYIFYDSYYSFNVTESASLLLAIRSGTVDAILCTDEVFKESIVKLGVFDDLESWLPADLTEQLGDKLYYGYASDSAAEQTALAIDVSEYLGYQSSDGTFYRMFLCFPNTAIRQETGVEFVRYILQKPGIAPGFIED